MWRNFDWICKTCGLRSGQLIQVAQGTPPADWPHFSELPCRRCGRETEHERVVSRPACYARAKIRAQIAGGTYDTMGRKRLTPFPKSPDKFESYAAFKDYVNTSEYREVTAKRKVEREQNEAKQARTKLMEAGADIDLREYKLPGDDPFIRE